MARIRSMKPGFFENEELANCSPLARLLFAGLWCWADREGRLRDRPRVLKNQILGFDDCDVDALLDELAAHGFIIRYQAEGEYYIAIPAFKAHQRPHPHEARSVIPPPSNDDEGASSDIDITSSDIATPSPSGTGTDNEKKSGGGNPSLSHRAREGDSPAAAVCQVLDVPLESEAGELIATVVTQYADSEPLIEARKWRLKQKNGMPPPDERVSRYSNWLRVEHDRRRKQAEEAAREAPNNRTPSLPELPPDPGEDAYVRQLFEQRVANADRQRHPHRPG